ncbi:MAG: hypothetical protein Q8P41_01705 [Pseudomonadota bacterium]|nr:hypothetical protein [Pseudomonadota bacterium]
MSTLLLALAAVSGPAAAAPFVLYDLQMEDGGFVAEGDAHQWSWGVVTNGPGAGFDGTRAWSTGLTRDYLNDSVDTLEIPVPDLTGVARPTLSFQHWYDIAPGDHAWIEVDTGNGFVMATPLYGYPVTSGFVGASGGWRTVVLDLSPFGPAPRVRLAFEADLGGAADGWTIDDVAFHDGDVAAPRLSGLSGLVDTEDLEGPYVVEVDAEDDTLVSTVTLWWTTGSLTGWARMDSTGGGGWRGEIPAQSPGTTVNYWVEASDGLNTSREPVDAELEFRVYLPAPTDLLGPEGRIVGATVPLSWTPPESSHEVLGYSVLRGGLSVMEVIHPWAEVPILGGAEIFEVRALYAAGGGDLSVPLGLDGVVPVIHGLEPASAWPGETLRVRLGGEYLLLVKGEVVADLGPGVTITGVDVRDVDSAWLNLELEHDANAGHRNLTLHSADMTITLAEAFDVLPDTDRPRLTAIAPESVRQGDQAELSIDFVGALDAAPQVDLGDGLVVESVEQTDANTLVVRYTVATDAALGDRTVTVDDGVRVFDGVTLEVKDAFITTSRGCDTPASGGTIPGVALALVGLAGTLARRRPQAEAPPADSRPIPE